jgi:hypothetical protein
MVIVLTSILYMIKVKNSLKNGPVKKQALHDILFTE